MWSSSVLVITFFMCSVFKDAIMMYTASCLVLSFIATSTLAQIPQKSIAQDPCISKTTCQDCIQTPSCAWCYDPQFMGRARCFLPYFPIASKEKQCKEEFSYNPGNIMTILSNLQLSKVKSKASSGQKIVQVAPQKVKLQLRARQSYRMFMTYTQAKDYPVDLYYIMDLSRSMVDDKERLSSLGDQLAQALPNITLDFNLGFGSFVNKAVMPNVSTLARKLIRPCDVCVASYGFHHHMSLSTNTSLFSRMIKETKVFGNLDAPERGFDAIMQAVECRYQIGWREQARRILVLSTDASSHYAGDDKLGGIVKPNDGRCHMINGYYDESFYQDYPSIAQINLAVRRTAINVFFAVNENTTWVYEQLANHIEGASVAKLEKDNSNIVELIKEQYERISSLVEMKHNASNAVRIQFFTNCLNDSGPLMNTNKCENIKVGNIIKFQIDIEILECPKERKDRFQTIQIYPVGINESLVIDLEILCECDCEKPGD